MAADLLIKKVKRQNKPMTVKKNNSFLFIKIAEIPITPKKSIVKKYFKKSEYDGSIVVVDTSTFALKKTYKSTNIKSQLVAFLSNMRNS
ncbi:TPA: hypothetical protein QEG49_000001 [Pluralibacter gergoviae]|nr:hypothetical protein [Pluralibacter gergoviae]